MQNQTQTGQRQTLRAGCLFAAVGGFAKALQNTGVNVEWANEKDKFAAETFRLNFPNVNYLLKPVEELSVTADELKPVDILTAGFPCQPFSVAGEKRGFDDERGLLFLHITRVIREFGKEKPKVLLLENVRNFKTHDKGRTFRRVQAEIQKAGYWFSESDTRILNTLDLTDIPQNRERMFMVAMSAEHFPANVFEFPTAQPRTLRPVVEFLDLETKAADKFYFQPGSQYHPLFEDAIREGKTDSIYQLRRSYVRENKSGTCFTLMANMGEGGHNQPVIQDNWGIRKITPIECARLHAYDDSWFKFPDGLSDAQAYKQMGNSVTVSLVERLVQNIVVALQKQQPVL